MKKRIIWITADYFIDVDLSLVPYIQQNYSEFQIDWYVIKTASNNIPIPNGPNEIFTLKHKGKDPRIIVDYKEIFNKIEILKSDIIYSDFLGVPYYFPFILLYTKRKKPIIHAAHNVIPYKGWPSRRLMTWYTNYIFQHNTNFQLFSRHLVEYFNNKFPNKNILLCPMTTKGYGTVTTNNYSLDASKRNLLFFGNVKDNKRLDLLINAIKTLPKERQAQLHLTIAGSCDEPELYKKMIGDCKSISYFFKRIKDEEVAELFTKHHFLVLPYENVAQSGPHMIAYHYNLPVIASDIAGMSEHIIDDKTGYLFKVNSKESLINTIEKALNMSTEDYQKMRENLNQYVNDNHSLSVIAKKYTDYFNIIIR